MAHPQAKEVDSLFQMLAACNVLPVEVHDGGDAWEPCAMMTVVADVCAVDMAHVRVKDLGDEEATLFIVLGNSPGELLADWSVKPDSRISCTIDDVADRFCKRWGA